MLLKSAVITELNDTMRDCVTTCVHDLSTCMAVQSQD